MLGCVGQRFGRDEVGADLDRLVVAMDIYSDHLSIDQEEQEPLRFSADDIIHLPIHTAINLWVARGTPRAGFVAGTLPCRTFTTRPSRSTTSPPNANAAAAT